MKQTGGLLTRPGITKTIRAIYQADRVEVGKVDLGQPLQEDESFTGREEPMQTREIANGWTVPYQKPY